MNDFKEEYSPDDGTDSGFETIKFELLPHLPPLQLCLTLEKMNNEIVALHGRDTLQKIYLFEISRIKIARRNADLTFINKCWDNKINIFYH